MNFIKRVCLHEKQKGISLPSFHSPNVDSNLKESTLILDIMEAIDQVVEDKSHNSLEPLLCILRLIWHKDLKNIHLCIQNLPEQVHMCREVLISWKSLESGFSQATGAFGKAVIVPGNCEMSKQTRCSSWAVELSSSKCSCFLGSLSWQQKIKTNLKFPQIESKLI
jgi:hypothetical protein